MSFSKLIFAAFLPFAVFADVLSAEELPAPVDLTDSEHDFAEQRRLIGPPSTWSVRHWREGQINDQNDHRCPYQEPSGSQWCSSADEGVECYYEEICCPDGKRCTGRVIAHCQHLLGPTNNIYRWTVSNYGQRYRKRGGLCYLGHASSTSNGRRRMQDELRGEPEMAVSTETDGLTDGLQEDSSLSRRLVGPAYTWPVDQWTPNPADCPWGVPTEDTYGDVWQSGLTCSYDKVCCPDGRCVANTRATCKEESYPCTWTVESYGMKKWKGGVCHLVHVPNLLY